jgi:hypothetical protein
MPLPTLQNFNVPTSAPSTALSALPNFVAASPESELLRQQLAVMQKELTDSRERERENNRQQEMRDLRDSFTKTLDETNKRLEAALTRLTERPQADPELADLKRRLESRDQLDAVRAETKAATDAMMALIRETTMNKGVDPVVNMLTTMLTSMQANAGNNFQLLREMANQERATMVQMMDKHADSMEKSGNLDIVNKVMSGMDMIFDRLRKVTELEREIAGNGNAGVDWMGVIREVGSRAGSAVQAFQQAKAREADAARFTAQADIAKAQASVVHDKATVAIAHRQQPQVAAVPLASPGEGAAEEASAAAPAPTTPAAVAASVPGTTPAPVALSAATIKELRALFKNEPDELFFGGFVEMIHQLRAEISEKPSEYSAEDIAGYVLEAREYIAVEAQKGNVPHAAEIFVHGQIGYLVERILPEASEGLRSEIVKAVKQVLAVEADAARVAAATAGPVTS